MIVTTNKFLIAALLLAGCQTSNVSLTEQTEESDFPAGPATYDVTGQQALSFFETVCLASAPDYKRAKEILASMPVTKSVAKGRFPEQFFHNEFNATVVLKDDGRCTLVAGGPSLNKVDAKLIEAADTTGLTRANAINTVNTTDVFITVERPAI